MPYISSGIPVFPVGENSARGYPVLYLDFDGPLHPNEVYQTKKGIVLRAPGHELFENVPILERILVQYPTVRIVLSTSWVVAKGFQFARSQLSPMLQERVLGATFHRRYMRKGEFLNMSRGMQVYSDAMRRNTGGWVALDDDDDGWPRACLDHLVCCDETAGLAGEQTQRELVAQLDSLTRLAAA